MIPHESLPLSWEWKIIMRIHPLAVEFSIFGGQRGIKNTFVLLAFPIVLQPAGGKASIWTKVYEFTEMSRFSRIFMKWVKIPTFDQK